MSDALPDPLTAVPPPRDRRIAATAAMSVALHLLLIGWLILPRMNLPDPTEPPAVNVDLVPPAALEAQSSSVAASSAPSASLVPSSQPPPSSADTSASDLPSSQEPPSSAVASSAAESSAAEPPSSAEAASSEAASSSPASDVASSMASAAASQQAASSAAPPVPMARPIVIPVGPSTVSSEETSSTADTSASEEPSSAASEPASSDAPSQTSGAPEASALTTTDSGAADAVAEASSQAQASASAEPIPPSLAGALHAAKRYYLDAMLNAPAMAKAREVIKKLPPEKRLAQTCNIEAVGQIGNAGKGYEPDAVIADAFAKPVIDGSKFAVPGGAFRSKQKWYGVAYECTLSDDMTAVKSFSLRIGADVTGALKAKVGG